ncbi:MAG: histidinol-phosphate transaminase [candidate division NC10 bacterium]|nr:histidinol-phosphate transaminase [candidate division NC10 bacterium]
MVRPLRALASPHLLSLRPYSPGKPIEEVERELGLTGPAKLASNENPLGPSPLAVKAIREAAAGVHRYPDGGGSALKARLAARLGVPPAQIALGNGSNELLEFAARIFLQPGDEAVMARPAFIIYRMACQALGAVPVEVPCRAHVHDLEAMAAAVTARTKLIFVGNPNNPTGTAVQPAALEAFVRRLPPELLLVLDEAYWEFLPEGERPPSLDWVREGRRCFVLRTFSKIYGLAGLRVGYGVGPPELIDLLDRLRAPFNVNAVAQAAAAAALEDDAHVSRTLAATAEGRLALAAGLAALGVPAVPSAANFLLVDVRRDGAAVADALLKRGVIVRPMGAYGLPTHLRITVGTPPENARALEALRAAFAA